MRSKVNYKVYGSNLKELERRALQVISELLQVDDAEELKSKVDFEMEISTESIIDSNELNQIESFVANVWAKIK